jgi:beta-lactamase class D
MKAKICDNIIDGFAGDLKPRYRIHFDKMLYSIGWFVGYVEIWKGKIPYERKIQQIPFAVHVTDWEHHEDCKKRENYRVLFSSNPWLTSLWRKDV